MSSLAVVIPLYNHAAYIEPTLRSVISQTTPPHRVIIIDDGSTDDSFAQAQTLVAQFSNTSIEVIRQENCGAHAALNRGIELAADCEFVAILNSDDLWHPERLERCLAKLLANPSLALVCTGLHLIDSAGQPLPEDSPKARRHRKVWALVEKENDPLLSLAVSNFAKTTSNLIARRSFLIAHPFGDYRYVHDYHFLLQAAFADTLGVLPDDLLGYRVHTTNTIKADGRRPVVAETVQMHLDLLGKMAPALSESATLRNRLRLYLQRLFGNYTDFRSQLFLQLIANAMQTHPSLFQTTTLGDYAEFESKSDPLPA